jgi:hypothetical protein
MKITENLKYMATSLAGRLLILCFGIALLLFPGPAILASFINPRVWFDALIALYFFVTGILAIVFFFRRKLLPLFIILPAFGYFLFVLAWQLFK